MRTGSGRYVLSGRAGWIRLGIVVWLVLVVELVARSVTVQGAMKAQAGQALRFDHIVIVIEENKGFSDIIGNTADAPYINQLADEGASFTEAHGEMHPSQQNYLALFSGSTQEGTVTGDYCIQPLSIPQPNLATELRAKQLSFAGYAEDKPSDSLQNCHRYLNKNLSNKEMKMYEGDEDPNGGKKWVSWVNPTTTNDPTEDTYVSKHTPWVNFKDAQLGEDLEWTSKLASSGNYSSLPTISIVIPNDWHNMHPTKDNHTIKSKDKPDQPPPHEKIQCGGVSLFMDDVDQSKSVQCGDAWLNANMSNYVTWAEKNNSLLIVTWDEDSSTETCSPPASACPTKYPMTYPDGKHVGTTPENNWIPTIFVGAHVKAGKYSEWINHYNILRTLEQMYGLDYLGISASMQPITDVWQ